MYNIGSIKILFKQMTYQNPFWLEIDWSFLNLNAIHVVVFEEHHMELEN